MSDNIGKVFGGRYEVREIIGTGGMAVVYKAYDTVLHRYVAIKVLKEEFAADNEFRKRFNNEAQAVAKLSHNNIVSIYDVSQDHSEAEYIVMELCEGVTLKDYLRKKHHLSWQETVYFSQQVARALDHAHSRGIIHQDIKPHNIMLLRDSTAKVMDFGIASFANSQETKKVSEAIGSVHYISPEQAKGIKVDYRTDLYSLGVVMYEMLTGTLPFRGDTAVAVVMQHINTVPPKPSELMPDIPPAMDEIVMHAMCANASQRYSSAMELLNDLERIRSNPNLYLNYTNRASSATRAIRYDDEEQATQLIRGVPVDPDAGYHMYEDDDEEEYEEYTPRRGGRKKQPSGTGIIIGGLVAVLAAALFALWAIFSGGSNVKLTVPDFVGMNYYEEIEGTNYEKQFTIRVEEAPIEDETDYEDGEVMMQDPEAGEKVKRGGKISLMIASLGADAEAQPEEDTEEEPEEELVSIPSVEGSSYQNAASALKALGLEVSREEENSDTVDKDDVISSDPASGEEVEKGSTVTLTVSIGPKEEKVSVPNLFGMTQSEAVSALEKLGLSVGDIDMEESDEPVGTIIRQTVSPGNEVAKGTSVGIVLAAEPPEYEDEEFPEEADPSDSSVGFTKDGGTTYIKIALPSDRSSVNVRVTVAGNTLYDSSVNCSRDSFTVHASYSGTERVQVTMDGQTIYDGDYNFAS